MSLTGGSANKAREVIDFCMANESTELKAKVFEILSRSGLEPSDPMFMALLLTGQMRVLIEAAPEGLNRLLSEWKQESANSLSEIATSISSIKQTSSEQAEAIRLNMEAVSQKCVSDIKEAGMAATSAIADANSETLNRVGQTQQQNERILSKLTALGLNLEANEQRSDKSKQAFVDWVGRTTKKFNQIVLELNSSRSKIERLQQKTGWLKWADWFSPLLALTIVGGAGFLIGGWLTYQKYNGFVEELGRDIMNWNLDRLVKCRQDNNPKCTLWIVPPDSPKRNE